MFDSVFSAHLEIPYEDDRPLIPVDVITTALDRIEEAATDRQVDILREQTEALLIRATPFLATDDLNGIYGLTWNASQQLQSPIAATWSLGWQVGSDHALAEMKAAIPPRLKKQAQERYAGVSDAVLSAIASLLLTEQGQSLTQSAAEQAVLQRAIVLAGNFSNDQLNAIKAHLIAAIVPQQDTGYPISRPELLKRIQGTLEVGRNRAEMIARTELTAAYNTSRVETMRQSDLVSYVRFLAISDARTTDICRSRNGMLIPINDGALAFNSPPPSCAVQIYPISGDARSKSAASEMGGRSRQELPGSLTCAIAERMALIGVSQVSQQAALAIQQGHGHIHLARHTLQDLLKLSE